MTDQISNADVVDVCVSRPHQNPEPHGLTLSSVVGFRRVVYQDGFYGAEIYVSTLLLLWPVEMKAKPRK